MVDYLLPALFRFWSDQNIFDPQSESLELEVKREEARKARKEPARMLSTVELIETMN